MQAVLNAWAERTEASKSAHDIALQWAQESRTGMLIQVIHQSIVAVAVAHLLCYAFSPCSYPNQALLTKAGVLH